MNNLMSSMLAVGLAASFAGCGVEQDSPAESETTASVTVGQWNWVINCNGIALRTCDNPGACATGGRIRYQDGQGGFVSYVDWSNKMAYLSDIDRWALATGVDGDAYLSINRPGSCIP